MAYQAAYPVPTCKECGIQSAGRCPTCHRSLCIDHFPREEHQPCSHKLKARERDYVCYVCGTPVRPQQWSSAVFAHYIDAHRCAGCRRYICDAQHTRVREEDVEIVRDGLRSHRYHITHRYCAVCAPLRRAGGLLGAASWLVGAGGVAVAGFLVYAQVWHHALVR